MAVLHTGVTVSFSEAGGTLMWVRDTDKQTNAGEEYLRLHPHVPDALFTTYGSIIKRSESQLNEEEVIIFSGTSLQSLKYPQASGVTIEIVGTVYDADGSSIIVSFTFNEKKNAIESSLSCYGIVRVRYTAPYVSYLYTYSGSPCSASIHQGVMTYTGGLNPASVIALDVNPKASAQISLTPDKCGASGSPSISDKSSGPVDMVLEIHKDFPPRIIGSTAEALQMGCKVRLVPNKGANIRISSGQVVQEGFNASANTYTKGEGVAVINNYRPVYTEYVVDLVQFNVSYSQNLRYQPASVVNIVDMGNFLDQWGNSVTPRLALPGDEIIEVEWISENSYANPVPRKVKQDEVVAVDPDNRAIDVYGVAKVGYTIYFNVYDVKFEQTTQYYPEDGFDTIHMVAEYGDESAYLQIDPPSMKEK